MNILEKKIWKPLLSLIFIFIVSRLIFYSDGVRFDSTTMDDFVQLLDPVLLKDRLMESLFFLHTQPPGFNFFIGLVLKSFPNCQDCIFASTYLFLGLTLSVSMFLLMILLGTHERIAFIMTVLFMISPEVILYENWLYVSYPETVLLCLSALFLCLFIRKQNLFNGFCFFASLMLLVFLRSIYHLFWFLFFLCFIFWVMKPHWKKVLSACAVPLVLVSALYIKNLCLFGNLSTSFNVMAYEMGHMTVASLSDQERDDLLRKGLITSGMNQELNHLMLLGRYSQSQFFLPATGIAVLDNFKKANGQPNFNSLYHLMSGRQHFKESLNAFLRYPQGYLRAMKLAYSFYFFPGPTDVPFMNRDKIQKYEDLYNFSFMHLNKINLGKLYYPLLWDCPSFLKIKWDFLSSCLFFLAILFYAGIILFSFRLLKKHARSDDSKHSSVSITICFFLVNILYVSIGSNAFAAWANNRYRFAVDPFYWILFALLLTEICKYFFNENTSSNKLRNV